MASTVAVTIITCISEEKIRIMQCEISQEADDDERSRWPGNVEMHNHRVTPVALAPPERAGT